MKWWSAACVVRLGIVMVAAMACAPGRASEHVAVQLSWLHQFQFAGYYVAKERGYYQQAGLDVELRPGGTAAPHPVDAVTQGTAQFGVGNSGLAVDRMNGAPVVALAAVLQSSPAVWIAPMRLDVHDVAAWRGLPRRIPFRVQDSSELLIPLAQAGQAPLASTSRIAEAGSAGFHDRQAVLRPGYMTKEVFQLQQAGEEFSVLDPRDFGIDFYAEVLFTSNAYLAQHPTVAARFRAATLRGWKAAFEDVEGTARLIRSIYAPGLSLEELVHEGRVMLKLARLDMVEIGHMSRARWDSIGAVQRAHGFTSAALAVDAFAPEQEQPASHLGPDPVRVALAGLLLALLFSGIRLLQVNGRLLRENRALSDSSSNRHAAEVRFHFLMDVAPYAIAIYAIESGRIVYANEQAMTWARSTDLVGHPVQDLLPALAPDQPLAAQLRRGGLLRDKEFPLAGASWRGDRWSSITGRAIEYQGEHCAFVAFSDITDRKAAQHENEMLSAQRALVLQEVEQLQQRLREASLRDALTTLYNRRYFDTTVEREFARCRRERELIGLLVVDADHFKKINDQHGHAVGDDVLRALGGILANAFRTEDVACRYGGEEFVVLMPHIDAQAALARAEVLRQAVQRCEVAGTSGPVRFTVSIGVAIADPQVDTPAQLFAGADKAVYAAKAAGRNRVQLAGPDRPGRAVDAAAPGLS